MKYLNNQLKRIPLLFCSTLAMLNTGEAQAEETIKKPNVLFIAVDDMNDWITPLGGLTGVKTPNLDRLASMSVTFTNAHCASPVSAPSRLSMMTGVHPVRSGVMENTWGDGPLWRSNPELKDAVTMEQFFHSQGYKNLAGGKIYHSLAPPWTITNQAEPENWDFWYPSAHVPMGYQVRADDDVIFPSDMIGQRYHYFTWGALKYSDEKMIDHQLVDWAKYELNREHEKPLFMAVGLFRPHMPWEVPQKYFDMYPLESIPDLVVKENDLEDGYIPSRRGWHKFVVQNNQWKHVIQAYLACLSFADAQIGRLLDALEESRYKDNTIVVLWSDHGMHMGEKETWEKFTLWEESTRVPLFIYAPGVTKAGMKCDIPVSLMDLYPTLAELTGGTPPPNCDGTSLVSLIKGETKTHPYPVTGYNYTEGIGYCVRTERYRYIYYPFNGLEEFYDHVVDSNEFDNNAYKPENKNLVLQHRQYLLEKIPTLTWNGKIPEGYELRTDYTIRNKNFIPLSELRIP